AKPIVFAGVADLAAPGTPKYGGNIYGFISYGKNLCGEWPKLLRAVAPQVARAAVLFDTDPARGGGRAVYQEIVTQAASLNPPLNVTTEINCGSATLAADLASFKNAAATPAGLIVAVSVLAAKNRQTIIDAANSLQLPAVYPNRLYTLQGGLASKGTYIQGLYRSAVAYARQLISGQQPATQIDITQTGLDPTKQAVFETVINAKAAAAIGLTVPQTVLMSADLIVN